MDWSNWIALLATTATFLFTLWVYFKHDKEIKSLEKEKLEREAKESKRAHFEVQYDWLFDGHTLSLKNTGKSAAKNIVISIESKKPLTFQDGTTQYRIKQLDMTEKIELIQLMGKHQHAIKVRLMWDDESGEGVTQTACVEDKGGNAFIRK